MVLHQDELECMRREYYQLLVSFQTFLRLCAGRAGQLVNLSTLGADAGVTHSTARPGSRCSRPVASSGACHRCKPRWPLGPELRGLRGEQSTATVVPWSKHATSDVVERGRVAVGTNKHHRQERGNLRRSKRKKARTLSGVTEPWARAGVIRVERGRWAKTRCSGHPEARERLITRARYPSCMFNWTQDEPSRSAPGSLAGPSQRCGNPVQRARTASRSGQKSSNPLQRPKKNRLAKQDGARTCSYGVCPGPTVPRTPVDLARRGRSPALCPAPSSPDILDRGHLRRNRSSSMPPAGTSECTHPGQQ